MILFAVSQYFIRPFDWRRIICGKPGEDITSSVIQWPSFSTLTATSRDTSLREIYGERVMKFNVGGFFYFAIYAVLVLVYHAL